MKITVVLLLTLYISLVTSTPWDGEVDSESEVRESAEKKVEKSDSGENQETKSGWSLMEEFEKMEELWLKLDDFSLLSSSHSSGIPIFHLCSDLLFVDSGHLLCRHRLPICTQ